MTDDYALDQLLRQGLRFSIDDETGEFIAYSQNDVRNGVVLVLKGRKDTHIRLDMTLGRGRTFRIIELAPSKRQKDGGISTVRQKLEALVEQAEECLKKTPAERGQELKNEILAAAIGWNS